MGKWCNGKHVRLQNGTMRVRILPSLPNITNVLFSERIRSHKEFYMARKKNPNNTVESVLGRGGIPRAKTVNTYKRCLGALENSDYDIDQTVNTLTSSGFFSTRKNLSSSSIRYYVKDVNRLPKSEQARLKTMSTTNIIVSITRYKK